MVCRGCQCNSGDVNSLRCDLFTYLQLWCAAGVNVTLGKTKDGGSVVGASVFYSTPPGGSGDATSQKCADDVERLDSELKVRPGFYNVHCCSF